MQVRSPTVLFWVAGLLLVLLVVSLRVKGAQRADEPRGALPPDTAADVQRSTSG